MICMQRCAVIDGIRANSSRKKGFLAGDATSCAAEEVDCGKEVLMAILSECVSQRESVQVVSMIDGY